MKFLLLGGSGYVGRALARELAGRGMAFEAPSHADLDARCREDVREFVRAVKPTHAINAIGYTGRPNIDSTEHEKLRTLEANTLIPGVLAEVFTEEGIPWGHVSSGCIYGGQRPGGGGWHEEDPPNFAFGDPRASWYSRTKAMAETLLDGCPRCLVWRMRIPFDERDNPRNYLSKLLRYERLLEVENSITHLGDFARVAVESLVRALPAGRYNIANPGVIRTSEVADMIAAAGLAHRPFEFFADEEEFLAVPGRVKRTSCELDTTRIEAAGLGLRPVREAIQWSLDHWQPEGSR